MSELLKGKRALVTGGASGIGLAIGSAFVDAGATVVLADRNPVVATVASEIGSEGVVLDATSESAIVGVVSDMVAQLGGIDILVCSHGILTQAPASEMTSAQWRETIDIDLTSVFMLNRAVLPTMVSQKDGRIINVASQLAIKGGVSLAHYAAAKAGVIAMTKSIAQEVAGDGVLVNAIAPGPIETPLVDGIDDDWKRAKRAELPLGRFGTPEEVAPTAVLLASNPGGNLYVGQVLGPNSGDVMP
ncbi:putative gluconate 5-dehydrogenase [Gordonia polyisoprenivorans NBRC 16320 = JCM 10675]|uniref:3-oxoacyl-[acyl-carrier-protein] reductase MabA n=1 Tax=Gordonia polyisoprenivorans TaxID=84595 RepID=A0A846WIY9_9ACTN|nr:SDR family NAD(P)-dependent oxidoreductase [Gordonia polyisoprenivorans]MBE7195157.1 SDR family oxidoreductase [Gordonia polyisoprenivorans]NKY01089.1 SDR family oxidoreductase [Gordonia polyisoprenivorans]OZC33197.1 NAD(P)-dependent oxidoreductase [Gordonia polyisoprenivorans]GAB22398.1 putative gluconate 5-dehydrogenase [Gordonia polyisoprenivorans NBRC 16320 = JCM 10675]